MKARKGNAGEWSLRVRQQIAALFLWKSGAISRLVRASHIIEGLPGNESAPPGDRRQNGELG